MVSEATTRGALWWVAAALGLVAVAWIYPMTPLVDWVQCPSRWIFDFPCPGCGMTRSVVTVVQGDVAGAIYYHAGGVLLVLGLLLIAGLVVLERLLRWGFVGWLTHHYRTHESLVWGVLGVLLMVYWGIRIVGGGHPDL